ncbi:hypothetical protein W97_00760 [Coniosporium apollinis CBS 100218]|uniref:Proteasome assembly chaperone 3 n=1 Tax=Coniosporium apollinis (strain CBS 100218) TaxID=1168221 RepID=R7YI26_CONA1|nr:uncharacterized protein W97_00760 [Coniosporium apollinis CBS 100218]EON61545.1 hypothetical protein W97_00760 [Coniosporium apollinis CBS 100218]
MAQPPPSSPVVPSLYPARSKTLSGDVNGIPTSILYMSFSDKILVTISQRGRLAHWVHVPLDSPTALDPSTQPPHSSSAYDADDSDSEAPPSDLLPLPHLTATPLLGGTDPAISTPGQLLATQIASAIAVRDADERRTVVVGMGLERGFGAPGRSSGREEFVGVVELVLRCLG